MRKSGQLALRSGSIKQQVRTALYAPENTALIDALYAESLKTLDRLDREALTSQVAGKDYFAFRKGKKISRAINQALYEPDRAQWKTLQAAMEVDDLSGLTSDEITRILYTMAISFCAAIDIIKDGDQKTPGTFFQNTPLPKVTSAIFAPSGT